MQQTAIDLILPNEHVGSVIGRGGAKINEIRSAYLDRDCQTVLRDSPLVIIL